MRRNEEDIDVDVPVETRVDDQFRSEGCMHKRLAQHFLEVDQRRIIVS